MRFVVSVSAKAIVVLTKVSTAYKVNHLNGNSNALCRSFCLCLHLCIAIYAAEQAKSCHQKSACYDYAPAPSQCQCEQHQCPCHDEQDVVDAIQWQCAADDVAQILACGERNECYEHHRSADDIHQTVGE